MGGIYSLGISEDGKVAFRWKANSEPDLAGYKLYIGTTPGVYSSVVELGMVTRFELTRLIRGMTYYFALTAYNTENAESAFTQELAYQVPLPIVTNAPPTLDAIPDMTMPEDVGAQIVMLTGITSGNSNEAQTLTISARSSAPDIIPDPIVNYSSPDLTGSLSLQPLANAFGTTVITVTVDDGGPENTQESRFFTINVRPVNDPPYFEPIADILLEEGTVVHPVLLSGIQSGAANEADALTVTATSTETNVVRIGEVIYSGSDTSALLILNPIPVATGMATITAMINDGPAQSSTFSRTFRVTIVNTPPAISSIPDQLVERNHASGPIPFTVSDAGTPAASLLVVAASSNPALLPLSGLILGGSDNNRWLIIDPASGRTGVAIITLTVTDESAATSTSFQVTVDPL